MIGLPAIAAITFHSGSRPNIETWMHTSDASIEIGVYHTADGQVTMMSLNDYILGVLAAEFQPDTPLNALKAGAVACRTYIIREKTVQGNKETIAGAHGADVTDSASLDMPIMSQQAMNAQYGVSNPGFLANLRTAIQSTDGLILTYQNKPILAFTTIVSTGQTRDAKDVIGSPVPYLKSVPCPADSKSTNRVHLFAFNQETLAKDLQISNLIPTNLKIASTDKLGFVQSVSYGKTVWSGAKFAAILNLPSSNFTFSSSTSTPSATSKQQLTIKTIGIGSDLGMSLNEASALAKSGKSWTDILQFFYPGTTRQLDADFDI